MNIKRAIFKVFSVNFIQILSSLIIGFVVPSILSLEGYANFKTYALFVSYVGFLHFGFIDGIYIKYGGKKIDSINKEEIKGEHNFLLVFQLVLATIIVIVGAFFNNIVLVLFGISILPIMLKSFHQSLYQATGEFDNYSRLLYIYTIIYTVLNIFLAIILKSTNYIFYCLTTLGANLLAVVIVEFNFWKKMKDVKAKISLSIIAKNIRTGFFILLGNLSVIALFGIDKIFVKIFYDPSNFAYYAFAVSLLNIVNTLVNAISITMYNYLFENNSEKIINKIKQYLILLGGLASMSYFVIYFIVCNFMEKYLPSLNIIAITFSVFPYMILVNALYVNLYKVNKEEKHYFKVVFKILLCSIIFNICAIVFFDNVCYVAIATIFTMITWVIYSTIDLDKIYFDKTMLLTLFTLTCGFYLSTIFLNNVIGFFVYGIVCWMTLRLLNRSLYFELKQLLINCIYNYRKILFNNFKKKDI